MPNTQSKKFPCSCQKFETEHKGNYFPSLGGISWVCCFCGHRKPLGESFKRLDDYDLLKESVLEKAAVARDRELAEMIRRLRDEKKKARMRGLDELTRMSQEFGGYKELEG